MVCNACKHEFTGDDDDEDDDDEYGGPTYIAVNVSATFYQCTPVTALWLTVFEIYRPPPITVRFLDRESKS